MFATQSRRAVAAWGALFDVEGGRAAPVTVLRLAIRIRRRRLPGRHSTSPANLPKHAGALDMML
jgi:hypothetical protein